MCPFKVISYHYSLPESEYRGLLVSLQQHVNKQACGHIRENNKNNFLGCVLYSNELNQMITELNRLGFEPWQNNLLYGNAMYSD